jgi:hypothetical protein
VPDPDRGASTTGASLAELIVFITARGQPETCSEASMT